MKNSSFELRRASRSIAPMPSTGRNRFQALAALLLLVPVTAIAQVPLPIPPTLSGDVINLSLQEGTREFFPGESSYTIGYNGDLLGPTIILEQGQEVTLNVTNNLPDLTTTHWHGMHVSAANDGGPHSLIYPNTTWSPSFTVLDRASTFWYHPHGHGLTDFQVSLGAAGMIIVHDDQEAALSLPRTYGVDDIPLILQAKSFVAGQITLHTGLDSVIMANGVRNAMATLPAQIVRLRCLNGASERTFLLGADNGIPLHVIGTDGGLLSAPVEVDRIQLMPGERLELLVDLAGREGETFRLMAYNSALPTGIIGAAQVGNGMATLDGYEENALNGADFPLLSIQVIAPTAEPITTIPPTLVPTLPFIEADAELTRSFVLTPETMGPLEMIEGPFLINGALMDMDVVNQVVNLGTTEIWEFTNNTMVGHPMHVHDIQFNILDRNGAAPEAWESGWKDVVYLPAQGSARVITRFTDFADPEMPYMYHCHLLMHEDEGMMGQFLVVDPNAIDETGTAAPALSVSPVPWSQGALRIEIPGCTGIASVELIDALGRIALRSSIVFTNGVSQLSPTVLQQGNYALRVLPAKGALPKSRMIFVRSPGE